MTHDSWVTKIILINWVALKRADLVEFLSGKLPVVTTDKLTFIMRIVVGVSARRTTKSQCLTDMVQASDPAKESLVAKHASKSSTIVYHVMVALHLPRFRVRITAFVDRTFVKAIYINKNVYSLERSLVDNQMSDISIIIFAFMLVLMLRSLRFVFPKKDVPSFVFFKLVLFFTSCSHFEFFKLIKMRAEADLYWKCPDAHETTGGVFWLNQFHHFL